jgi:filamentous hemagglutinin family protein
MQRRDSAINPGWLVWLASLTIPSIVVSAAQAQVIPDHTLGTGNNSITSTVGNRTDITGGLQRNSSLFHSFQQFSINTNQQVYFANPVSVRNIFSRVTGGSLSSIDGLLGVAGSANLFLINPNGIIFGPNARLDISGSFFATTADSLVFPDGQRFAATGDRAVPLVEVNIPIGLQFGANPPAMLTNRGNLSTGQNLTLSAGNLDLQGQLRSGGNLTLNATDTVKIRDTVTDPFVARSGGNLTIQGNQGIDILALNHPTIIPVVSGGNLTLISDGKISGDAHYTANGSFSILNSAGKAGDFFSIYDPIITAAGNVTFGNYTGASLRVTAGGSITTGSITINAVDPTVVDPNSAYSPNNPTLILQAGVTGTGNNPPVFPSTYTDPVTGTNTTFTTVAATTPAGITVGGNITTTLVQPFTVNLKAPGTISTQSIATPSGTTGYSQIAINSTAASVSINGDLSVNNIGTAGNIYIDAIQTVNINSSSLLSQGSIGFIFIGDTPFTTTAPQAIGLNKSSLLATNDQNGAGGIIKLRANSITATDSYLSTSSSGTASGGQITLTANSTPTSNGSIHLSESVIDASISSGTGSSPGLGVALNASTITLDTNSQISTSTTGSTNAGPITLTANSVNLDASALVSTTSSTGNGGDVTITTSFSNLNPANNHSVTIQNGSFINTAVQTGASGNGGNIAINTGTFALQDQSRVQTRTFGMGKAGDISLEFSNSAKIIGDTASSSATPSPFQLYSGILTSSEQPGNGVGGKITVNGTNGAIGSMTLSGGGFLSAETATSQAGGNVQINVNQLNLNTGGQVLTTSTGAGQAGAITVVAADGVNISGSRQPLANPVSPFTSLPNTGNNLFDLTGSFVGTNPNTLNIQNVGSNGSYVSVQRTTTGFSTNGNPLNLANGNAATANNAFDYYSFNVRQPGSLGIFDIDSASDPAKPAAQNIDTQIFLFDRATGRLLTANDDSPKQVGQGGSTSTLDSYFSYNFDSAGTYILAVGRYFTSGSSNSLLAGNQVLGGQTYTLQVSLQNQGASNSPVASRNPNQGLNSGLFAQSLSSGNGNNINITARSFSLTNRGELSATTAGQANGGNITVTTGVGTTPLPVNQNSILVDNGRIQTSILPPVDQLSAGLPSVVSGNVRLTAQSGSILLTNSNPLGQIDDSTLVSASTAGVGNAGTVTLETTGGGAIVVQNGARVESRTTGVGNFSNPSGNAGNIVVDAPNITISGSIPFNGQPLYSGLLASSDTAKSGQGGDIIINDVTHGAATGQTLQIDNGAFLSSLNRSDLSGGNITVNVNNLSLTNGGQIITAAEGLGRAGDITVNSANVQISGTNPNSSSFNPVPSGSGILPWVSGGQTIDVASLNNFSVNQNVAIDFSSTVPHVTIQGQGGAFDIYQLNNVGVGNRVVADVDNSLINTQFQDSQLFLFDSAGHLLAQNDDSRAEGAIRGSTSPLNSYLDYTFKAPGTYYVGIGRYATTPVPGSVALTGAVPDGNYILQLSVDRRNTLNPSQSVSSGLFAQSTGIGGAAGNITVNGGGTGQVTLSNGAQISGSTVGGVGRTIDLTGLNTLQVTNSLIAASTTGNGGSAGAVTINAAQSVNLSGTLPSGIGGVFTQASSGNGLAGAITVNTPRLTIENGAAIAASSDSSPSGGNIDLNLNTLQLNNGQVRAETQTGAAGNVTVNATSGAILANNSRLSVAANGSGQAGDISVTTPQLTVQDGAAIAASSVSAQSGGEISLSLNTLQLNNGQVTAETQTGGAGNVTVNATNGATLENNSLLSVAATGAGGTAGNLAISTGQLTVNSGSRVTVSSPTGQAGNLTVTTNNLRLDQGTLDATTGGGNGGANITLTVGPGGALWMRHGSLISANATNQANGGNITIAAPFIFGLTFEDSDIVANAVQGQGGKINITTNAIFGLQFRPKRTPLSDITASSDLGVSGTVTLNTLSTDVTRGLSTPAIVFTDVSRLTTSACEAAGAKASTNSELRIYGRGGIPLSPTAPLPAQTPSSDWVSLDVSPEFPTTVTFSNGKSVTLEPGQTYQVQALCVKSWQNQQHPTL